MSITELKRPKEGGKVPRYERFTETVEVEIDANDLHEAGWHHENECQAASDAELGPAPVRVPLRSAVEILHHQAHGPGSITLCLREPCSSLSLDQLRGAA